MSYVATCQVIMYLISKASMIAKLSEIVHANKHIIRGAIAGILFGFVYNYGRMGCLIGRNALEELYKTNEPDIPEMFLQNLSSPNIPTPGDDGFRQIIGVIFVVGDGITASHNKVLNDENKIYGDILQTNTKQNDNQKSILLLSGYQWIIQNLWGQTEYVINMDSNIFPYLPNLYEYIMRIEKYQKQNLIHCGFGMKRPRRKPRDPSFPNYVYLNDYNKPFFPSHCESNLVVSSFDMIRNLYETGILTKMTEVGPDVHIWGILREKIRKNQQQEKMNIISPEEFLNTSDAKIILPLAFQIPSLITKGKNPYNSYWNRTKSGFLISDSETVKNNNKENRVVLRKANLSDKTTADRDFKSFVYRWNRLPMRIV
uniref:uncharacterized protein LOC120331207 isoform X2 n=1 Tax=Styela clava TaxID=7725 RepID=UPI00193A3CF2|nr:uncharacterized protein LOC120331207 isoform X2 [Styela clava]